MTRVGEQCHARAFKWELPYGSLLFSQEARTGRDELRLNVGPNKGAVVDLNLMLNILGIVK